MNVTENPFTPSFGEIPAHLAGRNQIIESHSRALQSTRRRPELTTLFSGTRGTGKTALLSYLAEVAEQSGWIVVNITAIPGMLDDEEIQLRRKAAHLAEDDSKLAVKSLSVPDVISLSIEGTEAQTNWRSRVSDLTEGDADVFPCL